MEKKAEEQDFGQEKVLMEWESEERLKMSKSRDFYSTVMVLAILIGIVFFFIEGLMPVLVVAAIVFVVFAMSKVEPAMTQHQLTNKGIVSAGQRYLWEEMRTFWVDESQGRKLLHVLTTRRWPVQLVLILPKSEEKVNEAEVKKIVGQYVKWEVPAETRMDKAISWFNEKVPLE